MLQVIDRFNAAVAHRYPLFAMLAVLALSPIATAQQLTSTPAVSKSEFLNALLEGDAATLKSLLRRGANPNEVFGGTDAAPLTPLFILIAQDDEQLAKILVANSTRLNLQRTYDGYTAADLATYWLQDSLAQRIDGQANYQAPLNANATPNFAKTAWVANALAHLSRSNDLGTLLGLHYIVTASNSLPSPPNETLLTSARELRERYRAYANGRMGGANAQSLDMLQSFVLQSVDDKRLSLQMVVNMAQPYSQQTAAPPVNPSFGLAETRLHGSAQVNPFFEHTLEAAYELASRNAPLTDTINQLTADIFKAKVDSSVEQIISVNAANFHAGVTDLFTGTYDRASLGAAWTKVFTDIQQSTANSIQQLHSATQPASQAPTSPFATYESAVYILKTLASFKDPVLAQGIYTVGTAAIQVGKALHNFITAGVTTLASCTTLVGGIVTGIMSLVSLFGSGPSADQQILESIAALRQQVEDLRVEMNARFDQVDTQLNAIYTQMLYGFQSLDTDIALARKTLSTVAWQIALVDSEVMSVESNIRNYLEDGFDSLLWQQVRRCLDWNKNQTVPLPPSEFIKAMDALRQASTQNAADSLYSGRRLTSAELSDDSLLARQFLSMSASGLDSNIGLLQSVAQRFASGGVFAQAKLVNPVRWSIAVEAYARLAFLYPEYFRRYLTANEINEMTAVGQDWQAAIRSISATAAGGTPSLIQNLLTNYRNKVTLLRAAVSDSIDDYQTDNVEGYDLFGGVDQAPRPGIKRPPFGISELPPSEDFDFTKAQLPEVAHWKGDRNLAAPSILATYTDAGRILSRPLLIAHHLGLGEIRGRWRDPAWAESHTQATPGRLDEDRAYGKAAATVVIDFVVSKTVSTNGASGTMTDRTTVFSRQVNSGQDFNYGITAYRLRLDFAHKPPVDRIFAWTTTNLMFDPHSRVLLQEQLTSHWKDMSGHVFDGFSPDQNPFTLAPGLVRSEFAMQLVKLDAQLWSGFNGVDVKLTDARYQVNAAKAMLSALIAIGMPLSVSGNSALADALESNNTSKGQTAILDWTDLQNLHAKNNFTVVDLVRDAQWLDAPVARLDAILKGQQSVTQGNPMIESTMNRLALLKRFHKAGQSSQPIQVVAEDLRTKVQALGAN